MLTFKQFIRESSDFDISKLKIKQKEEGVFYAYHGRKHVGSASIWNDINTESPNKSVFKMVTKPEYRGKGVMRALHQHIENKLGKHLEVPTALSDDGFKFWQKYRPEAVKDDLRVHTEKLKGKDIEHKGQKVFIKSVGSGGVTAQYHDSDTTTYIPRSSLEKAGHV